AGAVSVVGAATPSEILRVMKCEADFVKLFPAKTFGTSYIREIRGPMPFAKFYVSGSLSADAALEFLRAGAELAGVGGAVLDRDDLARNDWERIAGRAR